jgi:hypothetical protein
MSEKSPEFWQCPRCKRRVTDAEHQLARYNHECPRRDCRAKLSDYVPIANKAIKGDYKWKE